MKAQSKSNAARTARNLTAKTGIQHYIEQVEGGWAAISETEVTERGFRIAEDEAQAEDRRRAAEALAEQEIREAEAGHAAWAAERETERQAALRAYEAKLAEADTRRLTLREAAAAVLAAWDNGANLDDLDAPMAALHAAVHPTPRPRPTGTTAERGETMKDQIIAMLKRETGASGPQMVDATGWQPHTVRGFLAGLKKKGMQVEVLDRVRPTGPNRTGAHGAYTIYRIAA